jgi:hypothetical protein
MPTAGAEASVRDVNAWKMAGEPLAMGDLIVGNLPASGQGLRAEVEPYVVDDRLAAYLELYSNSEATWTGATVTFEIADNQDGPPLASLPVQLTTGRQPTWRVASGVMPAQALPPGRYVARAQITRDGKRSACSCVRSCWSVRLVREPWRQAAVTAASLSFASSLPKFDRELAHEGELLTQMLDMVEKRSATLKDSDGRGACRTLRSRALEALDSGDQSAAAFLRGVDLFGRAARSGRDAAAALAAVRVGLLPGGVLSGCDLRVGRTRSRRGGCVADGARQRATATRRLHHGGRCPAARRTAWLGD